MWNKADFTFDGLYLKYQGRFIARFKHRGPVTKAIFMKQLQKRFTPATYFAAYDAGAAPTQILMNDDPAWHAQVIANWLAKHRVAA